MLADGIAVEAFTAGLFAPGIRKTVAILLLVLALVIAGGSFFRWLNFERAMRHRVPLPIPLIARVLAAGAAVVAGFMVAFVLLRPA
jgi:putative membrane protein